MVLYSKLRSRNEGCDDERFLVNVQQRCAWSKFVPQLPRSSLQTRLFHNMQRMHAFFGRLFRTVENKRFVNPTPKRKVARWNRAGAPLSEHIRISAFRIDCSAPICPAIFIGVCGTSREYVPEA